MHEMFDYGGVILVSVRLQMNSINVDEHEEVLASKLSQLEQQMYAECRDLLHSLEERKNNEYHYSGTLQ